MSATTSSVTGAIASGVPCVEANGQATRRITPEAGRALEILGHAIEYLTDEYLNKRGELSTSDSEIAAIDLLMRLNRQVYYECPVAHAWTERIWAFFRQGSH